MEHEFFKSNVARSLSDTHYEALLTDGDTLNLQYTGYPRVQTYVKGTGMTVDNNYATNEQLSVGTIPAIAAYYDDVKICVLTWKQALKNSINCWNVLLNV